MINDRRVEIERSIGLTLSQFRDPGKLSLLLPLRDLSFLSLSALSMKGCRFWTKYLGSCLSENRNG